jgi:hypothetical protein
MLVSIFVDAAFRRGMSVVAVMRGGVVRGERLMDRTRRAPCRSLCRERSARELPDKQKRRK